MLKRLLLLSIVIVGTIILSRYFPVLEQVEVFDNHHYSDAEIKTLANLDVGDPFLWITPWRIQALSNDPWISHVTVFRHWPNKISIRVVERKAFMTDGEVVYANDGTLLPNFNTAAEGLINFSAWGINRHTEMLSLMNMLIKHKQEPKMVSYTPAGFTIQLATRSLYTPSLEALRTHWSSFLSQNGTRVYVYPWGVSAVND